MSRRGVDEVWCVADSAGWQTTTPEFIPGLAEALKYSRAGLPDFAFAPLKLRRGRQSGEALLISHGIESAFDGKALGGMQGAGQAQKQTIRAQFAWRRRPPLPES